MASYKLWSNLPGNRRNMENMLSAVDPEAFFLNERGDALGQADYEIEVLIEDKDGFLLAKGTCRPKGGGEPYSLTILDREIADERYKPGDYKLRKKELIRRTVLELLQRQTETKVPWGILTGVRPTKVYHYLRDAGFSQVEIKEQLQKNYCLHQNKARLLVEIGEKQRPYFSTGKERIGVYVGIPFCPTRCDYCSFAAYPLGSHGHLVKKFLNALYFETKEIGALCQSLGLKVDCLYIGGGTPTVLEHQDLQDLLRLLNQCLPLTDEIEFTVEAGRPETLDLQKLKILKELNVNRVSVNPQTMKEETLKLIGRKHDVEQVIKAVSLVREAEIPSLNMDLIIGLPGEDATDWEKTLAKTLEFSPENLTLHTLAPKRAATWNFDTVKPVVNQALLADWLEKTVGHLRGIGYYPYYLYRQRRILANQENIGYCRDGEEGIYNILMMEERRTILGLGGGAMTKWVDPKTLSVSRTPNPKCPATYEGRIKELVEEKVINLKRYVN